MWKFDRSAPKLIVKNFFLDIRLIFDLQSINSAFKWSNFKKELL